MTTRVHDNLFVVVDNFSKMSVLMLCRKTIKGHEASQLFFCKCMHAFWIASFDCV